MRSSGTKAFFLISSGTSISGVSFFVCLLATLYPAWRASRTEPAEALRYE